MKNKKENYAFVDTQNVHLGVKDLGWGIDWKRFRVYLRDKYNVSVAYLFVGYVEKYINIYTSLQKSGYIIVFKEVLKGGKALSKETVMPN